jgi:HAMP domain-containing protein
MSSVRTYTSNNVAPLLQDDMDQQEQFIAETVPAFSARQVFENFRQKDERHERFFYKEATLNPTNPVDQADSFEQAIVEQMRRNPDLMEMSGFRDQDGQRLFYIARPLSVNAQSCLRCHSDPALAPDNLRTTYGAEGGFGWELNEIVAAQIIYVPAEEVFDTAMLSFWQLMAIFVIIFAITLILIKFLLQRYVIYPVGTMGDLAEKICADDLTAEDLETERVAKITRRSDELGALATVFRSMAQQIHVRTQTLKRQVQELTIEIDEIKRKQQVAEIVETDYFQDLQTRARSLRQQRRQKPAQESDEPSADSP